MTDVEKAVFAAVYARVWCESSDGELAIERAGQAIGGLRDAGERGPIVDDPDVREPRPPHPCLGILQAIGDRRLVSRDQAAVLFGEEPGFKSLWLQAIEEKLVRVDHDYLGEIKLTEAGERLLAEEGP